MSKASCLSLQRHILSVVFAGVLSLFAVSASAEPVLRIVSFTAAGSDQQKELDKITPVSMMERRFAGRFAKEWIAAWHSHGLERILENYEDDFGMSSPIIATLAGEPSGTLRGKTAVRAYWAKALEKAPNLRFELLAALAGVDSVTVYYRGHRGLSAEVLHFGPRGKVRTAFAHYAEASG